MKRHIVFGLNTVAILTVALGLASCGPKGGEQATQPTSAPGKNTTALKIGYSRLRISLPIFVAQEKGIFAKHGIDAQLQVYDTAQPMMQALVEGKLDIAGYTALPITYTAMQRSEKKLYFLTTMIEDQEHRISYLLRRKPAPGQKPTIKTIADLKGKKIGILPTIAYKSWLTIILKANGVNPNSVTIQQIAPTEQVMTLKSGGVDALFTNDPAATAGILTGAAELITNVVECPKYIENPFPFGSFNVSKGWADRNPEEFQKLAAALDEAVEFINANPKEAQQSMLPYLPDKFKKQVGKYPDARYWTTKESKEEVYNRLGKKYQQQGILKQPLDVTGLVVSVK